MGNHILNLETEAKIFIQLKAMFMSRAKSIYGIQKVLQQAFF